jgi:hypothetical protein
MSVKMKYASSMALMASLVAFISVCSGFESATSSSSSGSSNDPLRYYSLANLQSVSFTDLDSVPSGNVNGTNYFAYGTFQSNNRLVVSNSAGIFVSYLQKAKTDGDLLNQAVIKRSVDGGKTFGQTILTITDYSKAPCMETDSVGNLYLAYATNNYQDAYVIKLLASEGFTPPHSLKIAGAGAGKFSCAFKESTGVFYLLGWSRLDRVNVPGMTLIDDRQFFADGSSTVPEYPHTRSIPNRTDSISRSTTI